MVFSGLGASSPDSESVGGSLESLLHLQAGGGEMDVGILVLGLRRVV